MTKKQYLSKLRKCLQFKLPNSEIGEILSDMEECFEAGAAEGKSEEEVCRSLGEPASAAASLLNEQSGGERAAKLTEVWLPILIFAVLFTVYTYCGYQAGTDNYSDYVLPIMYVLPMITWILCERKGFFTALADYKCDFFTFFGSICMIAAGAACNKIPEKSIVYANEYAALQKYVIITAFFISAAMILLAVSLWKNAPKFFAAIPFVGIFSIIYNSVRLCSAYGLWNGDKADIVSAAAGIGGILSNILDIIFICASAFLIWSFIHRNALTLASAYSAMTVTGFMFYWYYTLSAVDPTDSNSLYVIKYSITGRNYLIWGGAAAAAVLILTVIIKLTGRKKVG